jgi:hypothetical protein
VQVAELSGLTTRQQVGAVDEAFLSQPSDRAHATTEAQRR